MAEALALPVLLSRVLGGVTGELQQTLEPATGVASLAVWSNVLRCVRDGGSERDLPADARISKRLAVAAVKGSRRRGWLTTAPGITRSRSHAHRYRAHECGRVGRAPVRRSMSCVGTRRCGYGSNRSWGSSPSSCRTSLRATAPWTRARSVGLFVAPRPDLGVPAHGQDWRPVLRSDGDTVSTVPLTGLLSQALVASSPSTTNPESGCDAR